MYSRKVNLFRILLVVVCVSVFGEIWGQSKATLEANKKKIEAEITQTTKLLERTRRNKKNSLAELELLNKNIQQRTKLVAVLQTDIASAEQQILKLGRAIERKENDIRILKEEYAAMLRSTYQRRDQYSLLMFIFASKDFQQAFRRIRYIQQYSGFIAEKKRLLVEKKESLIKDQKQYEQEKQKKEKSLSEKKKETVKLTSEQKSKTQLVSQLKKQEKQLSNQRKQQQKKMKELDDQIKKIIQEEIRKANELAKKKDAKAATSNTKFALTPEEKILSDNFSKNKGRLPWPTEKGIISSYFGTQPHPVIKNITIENNGIDIMTEPNSAARAVFSGVVSNVGNIYGLKFVMVRHGAYTTVYSNLDKVYVKKGDKVETKQKIGRIFTNGSENKTELQFQVWNGTQKENPSAWIAQ